MKRVLIALALLVIPAPSLWAQNVEPGCNPITHQLDRPDLYYFSLINAAPGQSANDWLTRMEWTHLKDGGNGLPDYNDHHGITNMRGASLRPRIFLPTGKPNGVGQYLRQIQIIADAPGQPGEFVWTWDEKYAGEDQPYAPGVCGVSASEPPKLPKPPEPTPGDDDGPTPPKPPMTEPPPAPAPTLTIDYERIRGFVLDSEARVIKAVNEPGWFTTVFGNRYVQIIIAGAGVWLEEHLRGN